MLFLFMRTVKIIIIIVLAIYWCVTLVYVTPNNYIRIKCNKALAHFEVFFSQRWAFFAPPPEYDYKLYYIFIDSDKNLSVFEALENILKVKKEKAPFNATEEFLDYSLSGSISYIIDFNKQYFDGYKFRFKDSTESFWNNEASKAVNLMNIRIPGYSTIVNYAHIVKEKNIKNKNIRHFKFIINGRYLPKFAERFSDKKKEVTFFQSEEIKF